MRARKRGIYIMTVILAAVILFLCFREVDVEIPFSFLAMTEESSEEIRVWKGRDEEYYVFVPSYLEMSQLKLRTVGRSPIWLDDIKLSDGMSCEEIQLDKPYELSYGYGYMTMVTFLQSEALPTIYIKTSSGNMNYIHEKKGHEEPGYISLYTAEGDLNYAGNMKSLKMRGNNVDFLKAIERYKIPYSLELPNEADLLGMGKAEKWILLSDSFDESHLRSRIVFDFASEFGMQHTPQCQWVELYLNGEYTGLYQLCERIEVKPQRLNISENGSFLVSQELAFRMEEQNLPYIQTEMGVALRIRNSTVSEEQLVKTWAAVERAIQSRDGVDPQTGVHWSELIDLDSWARKYLIEEFFGNLDGGAISQYFYMDGSDSTGKIYAGPVWDYDMTMGNPFISKPAAPNMLFVNRHGGTMGSPWYHVLWQDPMFRNYTIQLYQREFLPLAKELVSEKIEHYERKITKAAQTDQFLWATADPEEATNLLQDYLADRIDFFEDIWLDGQEYVIVTAKCSAKTFHYAVIKGDCLPELPKEWLYSWYDEETDLPIDPAQPIFEEKTVYNKRDPA